MLTVSGEERCVTTLITAAKETTMNVALLIVSASVKHHVKSDILSSYAFQLLPVQSRKSSPDNERCTQLIGAAN